MHEPAPSRERCRKRRRRPESIHAVTPNAGTSVSTVANQSQYRENLFDQLTGRRVLYYRQLTAGGFAVELWGYNSTNLPNGANRVQKPFISWDEIPATVVTTREDAVPANLTNIATTLEFRDPWGNPYIYLQPSQAHPDHQQVPSGTPTAPDHEHPHQGQQPH